MVFYKPLFSQEVFVHPRLTVVEDQIELPDGQPGDYLWFAGGRDAVTIIARNADAELLVQQEYSYLPGKALYQFVGGGVENGETLQTAAKRELAEETQSQANCLTLIGSISWITAVLDLKFTFLSVKTYRPAKALLTINMK